MRKEPSRRDQLLFVDQRHRGKQMLQRQAKPKTDRRVGSPPQLPNGGDRRSGELQLLDPKCELTVSEETTGLLPMGRGRGRRRENAGISNLHVAKLNCRTGLGTSPGGQMRCDRRGLSIEPRPHLLQLPAFRAVDRQQPAEKKLQARVEPRGNRGAMGLDMDEEHLVARPFKAGASSRKAKQDHADRPPVRRRCNAPEHRFGGGKAAEVDERLRLEIGFREPCRLEARDHEIERID